MTITLNQAIVDQVCETMAAQFSELLKTTDGRYLVGRFRKEYPEVRITEVKMLDLVLGQTRTEE